jgi:hypothetical protein
MTTKNEDREPFMLTIHADAGGVVEWVEDDDGAIVADVDFLGADNAEDLVLTVTNDARTQGRSGRAYDPRGWLNRASLTVTTDGELIFALSLGDPRGAMTFTARRRQDGRVVICVPHPTDGMPHVDLEEIRPGVMVTTEQIGAGAEDDDDGPEADAARAATSVRVPHRSAAPGITARRFTLEPRTPASPSNPRSTPAMTIPDTNPARANADKICTMALGAIHRAVASFNEAEPRRSDSRTWVTARMVYHEITTGRALTLWQIGATDCEPAPVFLHAYDVIAGRLIAPATEEDPARWVGRYVSTVTFRATLHGPHLVIEAHASACGGRFSREDLDIGNADDVAIDDFGDRVTALALYALTAEPDESVE